MATARTASARRPSLHDRLADRTACAERLKEAKNEISKVSAAVDSKKREIREIENQISGFEKDDDYKELLGKAQVRAAGARSDLASFEKRFDELTVEIKQLDNRLGDRSDAAELDDVLGYQRDVAAAQAEVERIQGLIDDQRAIIGAAELRLLPKNDLRSRREDLAAEVALGDANAKELQVLDREIEKLNQEAVLTASEAKPLIEQARQVIAGLERKRQAAQSKVAKLENARTEVITGFLFALAEEEARHYVRLADELKERYLRLTAIDLLLRNKGELVSTGGGGIISAGHGELYIPNFMKLSACTEPRPRYRDAPHNLFIAHRELESIEEVTAELLEEMRSQGVTIL